MENASKALLMAAGILVGILILSLMVTLFMSSRELSHRYEETKESESIQQFNVNFTKYIGQELTIHQVVTICNFAKKENNKIQEVTINGTTYAKDKIKDIVEGYSPNADSIKKYKLIIMSFSDKGYVNEIRFSEIP